MDELPMTLAGLDGRFASNRETAPSRPITTFIDSLRVLAPAGGFASPRQVLQAKRRLDQGLPQDQRSPDAVLADLIGDRLGVHASIYRSGKHALYTAFRLLNEQSGGSAVIAVAAYTCPDIAAAAFRAGCKVLPLDIEPDTLDFAPTAISDAASASAVVLSNLYGLPDAVTPWRAAGVLTIDDACQALLSRRGESRVGTLPQTIGILSFGRGKALSGVGGGALLLPPGSETLLGPLPENASPLNGSLKDDLYGLLLWALEHPVLYRLPASLPFLGLGRTEWHEDFSLEGISRAQAAHAAAQLARLDALATAFAATAAKWSDALSGLPIIEPFKTRGLTFDSSVAPLRYPILFRTPAERDHCLAALLRRGLGASCSYPAPFANFIPPNDPRLIDQETPNAAEAAKKILTLPTHRYVRTTDIDLAAAIIRQVVTR